MENNKYFDFAGMGVTTAILGYADKDVNQAVTKAINNASMGTLNSYEEVDLAEELLNIHKWADQVKLQEQAVRLAQLQLELLEQQHKKKSIIFGYHGWHDWYLSTILIVIH